MIWKTGLVKFTSMILEVCDLLLRKAGQNPEYQLSESGTAPAVMYGEVQAAESRNDFMYKMKMQLKELQESRITLHYSGASAGST